MYYVYTIAVPILLIVAIIIIKWPVRGVKSYAQIGVHCSFFFLFYALLLYYLESENFINASYSFLAVLLFYAIPSSVITVILWLVFLLKKIT